MFKPEELVCSKCSNVDGMAGVTKCKQHGTDSIDYKCRFCCSIALWFCFGTTHFCDDCHRVAYKTPIKPCLGKGSGCPLQVEHPPNGTEFALGCGLCRAVEINHKDF